LPDPFRSLEVTPPLLVRVNQERKEILLPEEASGVNFERFEELPYGRMKFVLIFDRLRRLNII
jgi:hypothetical protein